MAEGPSKSAEVLSDDGTNPTATGTSEIKSGWPRQQQNRTNMEKMQWQERRARSLRKH